MYFKVSWKTPRGKEQLWKILKMFWMEICADVLDTGQFWMPLNLLQIM